LELIFDTCGHLPGFNAEVFLDALRGMGQYAGDVVLSSVLHCVSLDAKAVVQARHLAVARAGSQRFLRDVGEKADDSWWSYRSNSGLSALFVGSEDFARIIEATRGDEAEEALQLIGLLAGFEGTALFRHLFAALENSTSGLERAVATAVSEGDADAVATFLGDTAVSEWIRGLCAKGASQAAFELLAATFARTDRVVEVAALVEVMEAALGADEEVARTVVKCLASIWKSGKGRFWAKDLTLLVERVFGDNWHWGVELGNDVFALAAAFAEHAPGPGLLGFGRKLLDLIPNAGWRTRDCVALMSVLFGSRNRAALTPIVLGTLATVSAFAVCSCEFRAEALTCLALALAASPKAGWWYVPILFRRAEQALCQSDEPETILAAFVLVSACLGADSRCGGTAPLDRAIRFTSEVVGDRRWGIFCLPNMVNSLGWALARVDVRDRLVSLDALAQAFECTLALFAVPIAADDSDSRNVILEAVFTGLAGVVNVCYEYAFMNERADAFFEPIRRLNAMLIEATNETLYAFLRYADQLSHMRMGRIGRFAQRPLMRRCLIWAAGASPIHRQLGERIGCAFFSVSAY
jgi:hypothetical protein